MTITFLDVGLFMLYALTWVSIVVSMACFLALMIDKVLTKK